MKGRADCTVSALANVAGITYELAEAIAADAGRVSSRRFKSSTLIDAAKEAGFAFRKLRFGGKTLARFIRLHPEGRFYVRKRGHALAVVDGVPSDSTPTGCILLDAWQLIKAD